MIVGLDHVQVAMPPGGEQQARAFYGAVLGMRETPKPEPLARRGGAWFVAGSAAIHVGVDDPFEPAKKAHPALLVADLGRVEHALREAGATFEIDRSIDGVRRGYTEDPFGNRIELIQDGDGSTQTQWR